MVAPHKTPAKKKVAPKHVQPVKRTKEEQERHKHVQHIKPKG